MRRLVDRWWLIGTALVFAVVTLTVVLYVGDTIRRQEQARVTGHQAVSLLNQSVDDVLGREVALARVVGTLPGDVSGRWPVLSNIVMSQPLANSTAFIQPVTERGRARFQRRTGLRLREALSPGVLRATRRRSLYFVVTASRQAGSGAPPLGLDLAADPLRRNLLSQAARTGRQLATPPVEFLGRKQQTRGVVAYVAVRDQRGRLEGWVSAAYGARQLAAMVTADMPGVRVTIRDGASTLVSTPGGAAGSPVIIPVAGRQWEVWAEVREPGMSAVPWLVLCLGLAITAAVMLLLRQAAIRAQYSTRQLAQRDAEEAAIGEIATLVAKKATPEAVFASVAEQVVKLFGSRTGAVSRFDAVGNTGLVMGGWTADGRSLAGAVYALDGATASSEVFRTGRPARIDGAYGSRNDPISGLMLELGGTAGVAAPIIVADKLWGALGAAYAGHLIPDGVEGRLERFASLVALAISNADAWDMLARQASSDPLTGIGNRRAFDERLSAEVARAHRYGRKLSLALIDIDHFKAVNDLHGHQAGDRVLVVFAHLLASQIRQGELVARIGGEEFIWLMPETDRQGAYAAADRVRKAIERTTIENVGSVTVSAGVCSTDNARDPESLLRNADRALYWAKDSGRNMTFVYTEEARAALSADA
jgi:diguanylate cyclase (GGDEF)-like protein